MNLAFDLLTVPGNLLLSLFLDADGPQEAALRETVAPWLGAVCWLTLLLIFRSVRPIARALRLSLPAPVCAADEKRARMWRGCSNFHVRDGWAVIWRAQAVHAYLYLGLPLIWEAGRWLLIALFLPIFIIGFGDNHIARTDGTLDHLRNPSCWTFASACQGPRSHFLHDPVMDLSQCVRDECPPGQSSVPDYGGWGWKAAWLAISAAWIGWWWRSRRVGTKTIASSRDP